MHLVPIHIIIYIGSLCVCDFSITVMKHELDKKSRHYKNIMEAMWALKIVCFIPYFNTLYAMAYILMSSYGYIFPKKITKNKNAN